SLILTSLAACIHATCHPSRLLDSSAIRLHSLVSLSHFGYLSVFFLFLNDPATTEIYTLSLHDALPILKISKGQVVFFEKITQKISTFKPLPIFILSVLSSLPKARLSKNKIFIVFRFSSVTDKTTQNKKDTREVSRIFYSAIAPD